MRMPGKHVSRRVNSWPGTPIPPCSAKKVKAEKREKAANTFEAVAREYLRKFIEKLSSHVYVAPGEVEAFATSFLATFGGISTPQVIVTVTPTPSKTSSQLLQTPSGTISLFGFRTGNGRCL